MVKLCVACEREREVTIFDPLISRRIAGIGAHSAQVATNVVWCVLST